MVGCSTVLGKRSMQPLVQLENICTLRQDQHGQSIVFLDTISCVALRGEITAIIGPSGGGKSSLIRLINRLEEPDNGRILLDGVDIMDMDPPQLRRRVGMMLQKAYMFDGTVLFNLQQSFRYRREPVPHPDNAIVQQCLALARLDPEYLDRDARSLSGGEQQRVNLARVLVNKPQVLLLDEPTSALDRPTADRLAATLQGICRSEQMAVIMVTHDLRLVERIADHVIFLEQGRIVEEGRGSIVLKQPESEAFRRFLAEPGTGEG